MPKPLAGIRVLDFSKILAGPLCTQYLSDLGAEVIKVESVGAGDDTRTWPPFAGPGQGAVYLSVNRGKRSIALDLKTEAGRAIAHRLARKADIAIESFGSGVAERLAIDEASLRGVNPDLIYCSISGFGTEGPMKGAPGYDVILQAFCGVMALTGDEGGPFIRSPISPIDQTTGMHALTGILAALFARSRGDGGRRIDVNLFDTALGLMAYNLQSYWLRGSQPVRSGSSHEGLCPYQAFDAQDGPLMIGVANDGLWRKFCGVAGLDHAKDDPRFATNPARVANRAETVAMVRDVVALRSVAWWCRELAAIRVPCAPINDLPGLMAEAQTLASGMVLEFGQRQGTAENAAEQSEPPLRGIGLPVRFDGAPREAGLPPPGHGQHGQEILTELGLTAAEIDALVLQKALVLPGARADASPGVPAADSP